MTITTNKLREHVNDQLFRWPGFSLISQAIESIPTLDIYLAGGVLRNYVSGSSLESKDFDFFVNGPQADFSQFLDFLHTHGDLDFGPFGSPRWRLQKNDEKYCDIVYIPRFDNGLWHCEDILDALNQFDFTANAIALDLRSDALIDPQNGMRDAERRILRAVRFDYPDEAISKELSLTRNCVLWMRLNHYAKLLGYAIDPITLQWLERNRHYASHQTLYDVVFKGKSHAPGHP